MPAAPLDLRGADARTAGTLLGAPHFAQDPCLNLHNYPLQRVERPAVRRPTAATSRADLATLGPRADLDFSGYVLDRVELHECNYNWKTFIEVYLEDYHVGPFHPGLGSFVTCDDLRWEFKRPVTRCRPWAWPTAWARPAARSTRSWQEQLLHYRDGKPPKYGAIWLTYYPHIMIEWYPHVLTVSTLHPAGPQKTLNMVEFFYPEEIVAFEREFVEAQQAAYMETCVEDDEIAERMDAGRTRADAARRQRSRPLPEPDGRRHAAVPRVVPRAMRPRSATV